MLTNYLTNPTGDRATCPKTFLHAATFPAVNGFCLLTWLQEAADDVITHGYCQRTATMPLLTASTAWYASRYGLELDPTTQALTLIG